MRQGMYGGTIGAMDFGLKRCSAPKTARGTATHKLVKATILSSLYGPRAATMSFFAAHAAIKKSAMPATHIAAAVRESPRNTARMVGRIDFRSLRSFGFYMANDASPRNPDRGVELKD